MGNYYTLFIGGSVVRIDTGKFSTYTYTSVPVHAFNPEILANYSSNLTGEILKKYDLKYPYMESYVEPFVIENKLVLLDGKYTHLIFVYPLD